MALKDPDHVMDMTVQIARTDFQMDDAFDLRVKAIEIGNASEELWGDLSDEHKDVLTKIYRRSLEVMHENVEAFLPNVLTGGAGDMIYMTTQVLLSQIEEEVEIIVQANNFEQDAARRQMIADLLGEVTPLTDDQFVDFVIDCLKTGTFIPATAVDRLVGMIRPDHVRGELRVAEAEESDAG